MDKINELEKRKKELLKEKKIINEVIKFYNDSLKFINLLTGEIADGMIIIITEDNIFSKYSPGRISHAMATNDLFDELSIDHPDFNKCSGDFGNIVANNYNYVLIRMASILNGPTLVYYPVNCNEYQITKLEDFNNIVKSFNSSKKRKHNINLEYNSQSGEVNYNLDSLIEEIKKKKRVTR